MQGRLGEKLIADLIREIAQRSASGLLRVSLGKTIKAVFFECGVPVFAISNVAGEQLDHALLERGYATPEQLEEAKKRHGKAHQLGRSLVEMNLIPEEDMRKIVRELVMQIIVSLFEWDQGEYAFDERVRAAHDVVLDSTADECILQGARRAAAKEKIARSILPDNSVLVQHEQNGESLRSLNLTPVESFLLSRLDSPTPTKEISALTGLPDEETRRALCALVSVGLLKQVGADRKVETPKKEKETDDDEFSGDRLREEVSRKLHFFASADFYEVLGITRRAKTGEIKSAYYQLAKKFHPDKYRQPEHSELRNKLEALFAKITQAYDTLSDSSERAAYDERIKNSSSLPPASAFPAAEGAVSLGERKPVAESPEDIPEPRAAHGPSQTVDETPILPAQPSATPPPQAAEFYYQQGRARYDKKDYYAAVQLLREAVKLDPNKPQYHFHLGIALTQNPRTRREGENHLVRAAELDPFSAQIRVRLGMLYKDAGLTKKAEHYFREALTIDPENRVAQRELGQSGKKEDSRIWKSDLGSIAKRIFKK